MLLVSPPTASAIAPHASERSWVAFVQTVPAKGGNGPVMIEGVKGNILGPWLAQIARYNADETMLIGLIASPTPIEHASAIAEQYAGAHLHDGWFAPTADLLAFVQHMGQEPLRALLEQTHPGALTETPVNIDEMAKILGCSTPTLRRRVARNEIPHLRIGRVLRFVPADVLATLRRGG